MTWQSCVLLGFYLSQGLGRGAPYSTFTYFGILHESMHTGRHGFPSE